MLRRDDHTIPTYVFKLVMFYRFDPMADLPTVNDHHFGTLPGI